ncbi:MAG: PQQ-dependent sugar dehydrogenase [Bacteroidota bacterium]
MAGDGSDRIFIVEKGGAIKLYDQLYTFKGIFLTVPGIATDGEHGLLSAVFHPDYVHNGFLYVYYTNISGNLELVRYHVSDNPDIADETSAAIMLTIPHPNNTNHNGGELHFGPDGYLYLSTGDGGGSGDVDNNAQNTSFYWGKFSGLM